MEILPLGVFVTFQETKKGNKKKYQLAGARDKDFSFTIKQISDQSSLNFIQKVIQKRNYVTLNVQDLSGQEHKIHAKISSLKKHLSLTKKEIDQAKNKGKLESLIKAREQILKDYYKICDRYEFENNQAKSRKDQSCPGISKKILEKVLLTALSERILDPTQNMIMVEGESFMVEEDSKNTPQILRLRTIKVLGKGSFGTAFLTYNLSVAKFQVLKRANKSFTDFGELPMEEIKKLQQEASESLKKEKNNLKYLNEYKPANITSIMKTPKFVSTIMTKEMETVYLVKHYSDNALSALDSVGLLGKLSKKEQVKAITIGGFELIKGLYYFKTKHFVHGDIKPQNIFVNLSALGNIEFVFADFAGGKVFGEPQECTRSYYPFEDERSYLAHRSQDYLYQRDIFATGVSLFILMTGKFPYKIYPKDYVVANLRKRPIFDSNYEANLKKQLECSGYHPKVCKLVMQMLDKDADSRIKVEDLFKEWEKIMIQEYQEPIAQAYHPSFSVLDTQKKFSLIENNPPMTEKKCYLIRNSMQHKNCFVLSTYSFDEVSRKNIMIETLFKIDSLNERIAILDNKENFHYWISFEDLSKNFGTPLTTS